MKHACAMGLGVGYIICLLGEALSWSWNIRIRAGWRLCKVAHKNGIAVCHASEQAGFLQPMCPGAQHVPRMDLGGGTT